MGFSSFTFFPTSIVLHVEVVCISGESYWISSAVNAEMCNKSINLKIGFCLQFYTNTITRNS